MEAELISIGDELISGQTVDTNAAWLSSELETLGVLVARHVTVGDDAASIRQAVVDALARSALVIVTGGLGPTPDDRTREGVAAALVRPLEEHPQALEELRAFFARLGRPFTESNRVQAEVPRGCTPIPNARGTAPGIHHAGKEGALYVLPGVPAEMRAMFRDAVAPALRAEPSGLFVRRAKVCVFGRSEAAVGELLKDLMDSGRNPTVGVTASRGILTVHVVAKEGDEEEATRRVQADVEAIRRCLGSAAFGTAEDTMEGVIGALLLDRGATLATAESCTGGLLGARVTEVPGSSAYYRCGYVTYANEAKTKLLGVEPGLIEAEGAVSEAVARAMASGGRAACGADFALSITGIAGPDGGRPPDKPVGLVFIGLASPTGVDVRRILFGEHLSRSEIRDRACTSALNLLRLKLLGDSSGRSGVGEELIGGGGGG